MPDPKDGETFLRKVVRFVANPTTDWADINSRQDLNPNAEFEKSELKAMVERKRRNDFVRKNEFDLLRRVRREGLTPEQLAALGGSSRLDDSEARPSEGMARADVGVKAKIDEIEQQMVGAPVPAPAFAARQPPGFFEAPTQPAALPLSRPQSDFGALPPTAPAPDLPPALPPLPDSERPATAPVTMAAGIAPLSSVATGTPGHGGAATTPALRPPPIGSQPVTGGGVDFGEVVHDPELDEAVIAFANADFDHCEQSLDTLTSPRGSRARHAETWLVRFDLYRATGQQPKFEALAVEFAQRFGWSAPQWFSLPRLVADAVAGERPRKRKDASDTGSGAAGPVGWVCPAALDLDAVARLRSQTLQMPLPWVFDWSAVSTVETEAAAQLTDLLRQWAPQTLEMRWQDGDRLLAVLAEQAPTGARDVDPAFWTTRLEVLRLANRPDQFDEVAIDFCVTFEVSPPSWERAKCKLRMTGPGRNTHSPALSQVSEVSTTFFESSIADDFGAPSQPGGMRAASVELSGQLVGGIDETLKRLDEDLEDSVVVNVSCARLIRVDFLAAGDLLNWVLAKRNEGRQVNFTDAHRLVALFFGAMGINEHARVRVRHV